MIDGEVAAIRRPCDSSSGTGLCRSGVGTALPVVGPACDQPPSRRNCAALAFFDDGAAKVPRPRPALGASSWNSRGPSARRAAETRPTGSKQQFKKRHRKEHDMQDAKKFFIHLATPIRSGGRTRSRASMSCGSIRSIDHSSGSHSTSFLCVRWSSI